MSKFNIASIEAVKSQAVEAGAKLRIRYYAEGKECAKDAAEEFSFTVTNDVEFEVVAEEVVEEAVAHEEEIVARNAAGRKLPTERKGQVTKASVLREKIAEELASGNYDKKQLVDWAVEELGFKRPLARVYVKNLTPA